MCQHVMCLCAPRAGWWRCRWYPAQPPAPSLCVPTDAEGEVTEVSYTRISCKAPAACAIASCEGGAGLPASDSSLHMQARLIGMWLGASIC